MRWLLAVVLMVGLAACGGGAAGGASYTADQAVAAFKAAGLPADNPQPMGAKEYGAGPMLGKGIIFQPTGLCEKCNVRVIAFENDADLQKLKAYYDDLGKGSALLASHTFVHGNLLVQMAARQGVSDADAKRYEAALKTVE